MKNPYYPTALGLYFNYLVHGMGVILMSLNMASLETLWQTNAAGVSIVISSLGIGRLSVLLFAGLLSDRFGRRPFIMLGMCCYMAFFFGILQTNNIIIAYVFGGNDSNLLIVFYVQIMPDDFVMQLHRF
ncbi:hypothetical protein MZ16F92_08660 [Escherichia coli]